MKSLIFLKFEKNLIRFQRLNCLFATMGACNLPPLSSAKTIGQIFIRAAAQSPVLLTEQRQYVATQLHRVMAADSEDF